MTQEELSKAVDELLELEGKATKGPWEIGMTFDKWPCYRLRQIKNPHDFRESEYNMRFIEQSRNLIKPLCEQLKRQERALKFYADPKSWCNMGKGAYSDLGNKARHALEGDDEEEI